jgi:hypothetical protein
MRNIQKTCIIKIKSVKSINPSISVIQTGYDIVTKGHGGAMEVETTEGIGTRFIVSLPA